MDWKRRNILDAKNLALEEADLKGKKAADDYSGPATLRPIPSDAKPITYEELMAMVFKEEEKPEKEALKVQQLTEWRSSRKQVDVNALFAPR